MNKVIIGVPVFNDLSWMQQMLASLMQSTTSYDSIHIVDGGSTDGTVEWLDYISKVNPKIKVHKENTETPIQAYNFLFKLALFEGTDLLITQTDVLFPVRLGGNWLTEMQMIAEEEAVGAVVPWNGCGISGLDYVDGLRWLGGWCTYYTNRAIQKIGGYDTNFPNGFGVDIDHTYRLMKEGLQVRMIDYWVNHHQLNRRAHDRDAGSEEAKQASSKFFKEKWKL